MHRHDYFDTYKRYKSGTADVLRWIGEASGFEAPVQGRKRGAQPSKPSSLPLKALPDLARKITQSGGLQAVPCHVLQTLEWVISARKECAAHHRLPNDEADDSKKRSDQGHEHFLGVLVQVLGILRSSGKAGAAKDDQRSQRRQDLTFGASLTNRFEHLDLIEPKAPESSNNEGLQSAKLTKRSEEPPSLAVLEDPAEESRFACFCFWKDWHNIKQFVQTIWRDYQSRKTTLTVAAITSNSAIDSIERVHNGLVREFPQYAEYLTLDDMILSDANVSVLDDTSSLPREMRDNDAFADRYDFEAPLPGRESFSMLQHFGEAYSRGIFKDFHDEDTEFDWAKWCNEGTVLRTQLRKMNTLVRFVPDMIAFVGDLGGESHPVDQLTHRIFQFFNTHKITVPLVFACDIFVDIMYILMTDIERPYQELLDVTKKATDTFKRYDVYTNKVLKCDRAMELTLKTIHVTQDCIQQLVSEDRVATFRASHVRPLRENLPPHCLLKHHPMLCGMLRFHIDRSLYYIGLRMCNEWMCVLSTVHLYNAVRQSGHLTRIWCDLDHIIDFYGAEYLYVARPASSAQDWPSRLLTALGLPPSVAGRERRKKDASQTASLLRKVQTSRTSGRLMQVQTPLLTVMRDRYRIANKKTGGTILHEAGLAIDDIPELTQEQHVSRETAQIARRWKAERFATPVGLLKLISEGVRREDFTLHFDFCEMNRRCVELLRRVRDWAREHRAGDPLMEVCGKNEGLYFVAQMVFSEVLVEGDRVGGKGPRSSLSMLQVVADRMEQMIEREGGKESAKAAKECLWPEERGKAV